MGCTLKKPFVSGTLISASALTFCIFCTVIESHAQQKVQRDSQAIAAAQLAISALGDQVSQISDSVISGSTAPAPGSWTKPGSFVWQTQGTEFKSVYTTATKQTSIASGHGRPAISINGKVTPQYYHALASMLPFHLSGPTLASLVADLNRSFAYVAVEELAGKPVVHVQTCENLNGTKLEHTQQDWYFDSVTGLPARVSYREPSYFDAATYDTATLDFLKYQSFSGIPLPTMVIYSQNGVALSIATITSAAFNTGVNASTFDLAGAQ
jgi:hypothetical protein